MPGSLVSNAKNMKTALQDQLEGLSHPATLFVCSSGQSHSPAKLKSKAEWIQLYFDCCQPLVIVHTELVVV